MYPNAFAASSCLAWPLVPSTAGTGAVLSLTPYWKPIKDAQVQLEKEAMLSSTLMGCTGEHYTTTLVTRTQFGAHQWLPLVHFSAEGEHPVRDTLGDFSASVTKNGSGRAEKWTRDRQRV